MACWKIPHLWINDWPIYEPQFIDDHFWASHVGVPEGHVFREGEGECKEMGCLMTKPPAARKTPLSAEEQKEFAQLQIRDGRWWEYSLATLNPCWLINYMALCCVDDVSWGLYGLRIAHFNFWGFGHCSVELHMEAFIRPKTTSKWDLQSFWLGHAEESGWNLQSETAQRVWVQPLSGTFSGGSPQMLSWALLYRLYG